MNNKWQKISFIVVDVIVLGFFGFYLTLNLKSDEVELEDNGFVAKTLANGSDTSDTNTVTCTGNTIKNSSGGCSSCPTGKHANSNHTSCLCDDIDDVVMPSCGTISVGEAATNCDGLPSGSDISCTASGPAKIVGTGITAGSVSKSQCTASASVTCTRTHPNSDCSNKSASVSFTVKVPWGTSTKEKYTSRYDLGQYQAETNPGNSDVYYSNCNPNDVDKYGRQKCTEHGRACGSHAEPQPHCYKDKWGFLRYEYLEKLTNDKSAVDYSAVTSKGYEIAKDANGNEIPESQCYTEFKCSTKYPGADEKESTCNSTNDFSGDYIKKCGVKKNDTIGDEFYRIDCKETMKTGFNGPIFNDSNYPNSFLYPGTAFKFNYVAKTKVVCEGKWHQDFYEAAENYVKSYIDKRSINSFHQEDAGFFSSALEGVHNVLNSYKNWKLNYFNTSFPQEKGTIQDIQPTVSGTSKDENTFSLELVDGYKTQKSSCGSEPNGEAKDFSYQVTYNIQMQMPILYYSDSQKPQYTTTETSGYKVLGRVFPISDIKEYANRNDYKYTVKIENLGLGHKWNNNETCSIAVKDKEIVFRSINLNDPFIQQLDSDHQIGENWKNSKFDFTNIIDKNTWSNPSQYNQVRIDEQVGKLIKEELSKQYASYLGSCSKGTDKGTTPQICALYKQAIAGKE